MPIKLMAVSRRRPGLTRAEYFRYIEHYHGTVARLERFKIDKYMQNHVIDGAFGVLSDTSHHNRSPSATRVVELHFSTFRDMLATLEPEGVTQSRGQPGRPVLRRRAAPTSSSWPRRPRCRCRTPVPTFNPGLGEPGRGRAQGHAVHHAQARGLPQRLLQALARGARRGDGRSRRTRSEQFRKIVVSKRCRANDNDAAARAHFKMVDPPVYDMVVSFWCDSIEQAGAFRQYFDALQEQPARLRRLVGVVLPVRPAGPHHRRRAAERLTAPDRRRT